MPPLQFVNLKDQQHSLLMEDASQLAELFRTPIVKWNHVNISKQIIDPYKYPSWISHHVRTGVQLA